MKFNIIDYITQKTNLKQKDIAAKLKVSRAQVSKWKAGEHIPFDRQEVLNELAGLFGDIPEWAILVGTKENGKAWIDYVSALCEYSEVEICCDLIDSKDICVPLFILLLNRLGVSVPTNPPVLIKLKNDDNCTLSKFDLLIIDFIEKYSMINHWYNKFFIYNENNDKLIELATNLESMAIDISIKYLDEEFVCLNFINRKLLNAHILETDRVANKIIEEFCNIMIVHGYPIVVDYFNYINTDPHYLYYENFFKNSYKHKSVIPFYISYSDRIIMDKIDENNALMKKVISLLEGINA